MVLSSKTTLLLLFLFGGGYLIWYVSQSANSDTDTDTPPSPIATTSSPKIVTPEIVTSPMPVTSSPTVVTSSPTVVETSPEVYCDFTKPDLHADYLAVNPLRNPNISLVKAWLKPEYPRLGGPIETIPEHLRNAYTMNGQVEMGNWVINDAYFGDKVVWTKALVDKFREAATRRESPVYETQDIHNGLTAFRDKVEGKRGLVIGSAEPWLVAILLEYGASQLLATEFLAVISEHPQIQTMYAPDFTEQWLRGKIEPFDFAISFSCLEHDGLGRYGDVLNPIGDLQSAGKVLSFVKPGGFFFLGVPSTIQDKVVWNAHRVYGPIRLRQLLAGWNLVAVFPSAMFTSGDHNQPLMVLQNPYGCTNGKSYEEIYPEQFRLYGVGKPNSSSGL